MSRRIGFEQLTAFEQDYVLENEPRDRRVGGVVVVFVTWLLCWVVDQATTVPAPPTDDVPPAVYVHPEGDN